MYKLNIKTIHNVSRPGEVPIPGDLVEVETLTGFVREVDPRTRKCREAHQRFRLGDDGSLMPLPKPPARDLADRLAREPRQTKEAALCDAVVTAFEMLQAKGIVLVGADDGVALDKQQFIDAMVLAMNAALGADRLAREEKA